MTGSQTLTSTVAPLSTTVIAHSLTDGSLTGATVNSHIGVSVAVCSASCSAVLSTTLVSVGATVSPGATVSTACAMVVALDAVSSADCAAATTASFSDCDAKHVVVDSLRARPLAPCSLLPPPHAPSAMSTSSAKTCFTECAGLRR